MCDKSTYRGVGIGYVIEKKSVQLPKLNFESSRSFPRAVELLRESSMTHNLSNRLFSSSKLFCNSKLIFSYNRNAYN